MLRDIVAVLFSSLMRGWMVVERSSLWRRRGTTPDCIILEKTEN